MNENIHQESKTPVSAIVAFIILILILIGGYWWWSSRDVSEPAGTLESYGLVSTTTPAETTAPLSTTTQIMKNFSHTITIETNKGTIVFETYDADAPATAKNFVDLANKGFYNGVIFHRVIPGFMIQGGDPTGTGRGGPGYKFADELNPSTESYKKGYVKGTVAMANSGPNTNGSQFFIMLEDNLSLPPNYTIFGKVTKGQDVVSKIQVGDLMNTVTIAPLK
jgi:cyclophilin family peptidyl-prolyl cis-trans isomerase